MGTIAENSATVSSTSVHTRARYLTATANSSSLFFLLSRGLEYIRIKGKAHLFQLSRDLSFSVKREHNNNSTADKRELNDTHQLAVSTCRAHTGHGVPCLHGLSLVQVSHAPACLLLEGKPLCIHRDEEIINGFSNSPVQRAGEIKPPWGL